MKTQTIHIVILLIFLPFIYGETGRNGSQPRYKYRYRMMMKLRREMKDLKNVMEKYMEKIAPTTSTSTPTTTSAPTSTPAQTNFGIIEGNETFVQENSFQKETGILVLNVPPHNNYTESVFMMNQESEMLMVKNSNSCQIGDLPQFFNVSSIAEKFETSKSNNQSKTVSNFFLKARKSRIGAKRREQLLPDVQDLCKTVPMVKTIDVEVNETQFDKYKRGEVIYLDTTRNTRKKCHPQHEACSVAKAPNQYNISTTGCAYWPNPDTGAKSFAFHYISGGSVCVDCNIQLSGSGANCSDSWCMCKDIVNKTTLYDCSIKSGVNTTHQLCPDSSSHSSCTWNRQSLDTWDQTMLYNRNETERSIVISSPAHNGLGALDVVMHSDQWGDWKYSKDSLLIKSANSCYISSIRSRYMRYRDKFYPLDIAFGIQEIEKGNDITTGEDEVEKHIILVDTRSLTEEEVENLHPDIQSRCRGSTYTYYDEFSATKDQIEDFKNGQIIVKEYSSYSTIMSAVYSSQNSGSWLWPNPDKNEKLWINEIVHSANGVACCSNTASRPNDCQDTYPEYCLCENINYGNFKQCSEPQTKKALFVATGDDLTKLSLVEILTEDEFGMFTAKQVDIGGCSEVSDFPVATVSAIGALFNNLPHVCVGYTGVGPNRECFGYNTDGSWENKFNLTKPINEEGSSVVFDDWKGIAKPWWILGGDPDGGSTEVWGGEPPAEISDGEIKLPQMVHHPNCITKISGHEAFVTAVPKSGSVSSNFAWIFNIQANNWTRLPDTLERRYGPACGLLSNDSGSFVVLAGGYHSSTTEIFNLDTFTWTLGPSIGVDLNGGSMVSLVHQQELLLIGGFSTTPLSNIQRMNSSMSSWETVGQLTTARFHTVAIAVSIGNLPPLCP